MEVDTETLRTLLKFNGITTEYTDTELEILYNSKINELEGLVGVDINPHERVKVTRRFHNDVIGLNFYPVISITNVYIDDNIVDPTLYNVNWDLGLIYFKDYTEGVLKVEYTSGVSEADFTYLISPLIQDMITYTISFGNVNSKLGGWGYVASSLHEGDVSMNFSNGATSGGVGSYGYSGAINNKIDELKKKYSNARVRWV